MINAMEMTRWGRVGTSGVQVRGQAASQTGWSVLTEKVREEPRVSGKEHSRQREQQVLRAWGGGGPGVFEEQGQQKELKLKMK